MRGRRGGDSFKLCAFVYMCVCVYRGVLVLTGFSYLSAAGLSWTGLLSNTIISTHSLSDPCTSAHTHSHSPYSVALASADSANMESKGTDKELTTPGRLAHS